MAGKFQWKKFRDVDVNDDFFDSLKCDYDNFVEWFQRKSIQGEETLVYLDSSGIGAFLYLKDEEETIDLEDRILQAIKRIKIGTLRLSERQRGIRLGEGALGVALWKWQEKKVDEIYVTVFEKHEVLIKLFIKFGFRFFGKNHRGECVYLKDRKSLDYSDPYMCFPFIRSSFEKAGMIPINETFHDRLFPYSEIMGNRKEIEEITAGNGITKVYIGSPYSLVHYAVGEPVAIYRIYEGESGKTYKSAITSYATITKIIEVKSNGLCKKSLDEYIDLAGNKTVFNKNELQYIYNSNRNVIMIEMVYNGFFGKGHNVNHRTLSDNGLFPAHPYKIDYKRNEFIQILEMGDANVQNIIIN